MRRSFNHPAEPANCGCELSIVIPVFNGSETIVPLVERIHTLFQSMTFEVVLVNDGSHDDSERTCACLVERFPGHVRFMQLSRNFGEHNAVLAGLNHIRGRYVAILDDDGQNPPEEILPMLKELQEHNRDVVYGYYIEKKHSRFRNWGSRFHNRMATIMLQKPPEIYLSSFKVMNRFVVDEIIKYRGAFPYIDGLIYRTTDNIGQVAVEHRAAGRESRYTFKKLVLLWLNMFLNFSIVPLRACSYFGLFTAVFSVLVLALIWIDKIYFSKDMTPGIRTVLAAVSLFSGIQLMIIGLVGEYLGRLYLDQTGTPQYIVRYSIQKPQAGI